MHGVACSLLNPTQLVYQTLTSSNRPSFNRGVATLLVTVLLSRPNECIKKVTDRLALIKKCSVYALSPGVIHLRNII